MIKILRFFLNSKKKDKEVCAIKAEMTKEADDVRFKLHKVNHLLKGAKRLQVVPAS